MRPRNVLATELNSGQCKHNPYSTRYKCHGDNSRYPLLLWRHRLRDRLFWCYILRDLPWSYCSDIWEPHYNDVKMSATASQITTLMIVYSTVYSGADQRKHQNSASLSFVLGIHRWPVNSPHTWPVTRKIFPFDDVIMSVVSSDTAGCHNDNLRCLLVTTKFISWQISILS